jgi:hypothetical protein
VAVVTNPYESASTASSTKSPASKFVVAGVSLFLCGVALAVAGFVLTEVAYKSLPSEPTSADLAQRMLGAMLAVGAAIISAVSGVIWVVIGLLKR